MADERITSVSQGTRRVFAQHKFGFTLAVVSLVVLLVVYFAIEVVVSDEDMGDVVQLAIFSVGAFIIAYIGRLIAASRALFWRHFAEDHGLAYHKKGDASVEQAAMFHRHHGLKVGDLSPAIIKNVVSGTVDGRPARVFELSFARGYGKSRDWYYFTVIEFKVNGYFPHIFLNRLGSGFSEAVSGRTRIFVSDKFAEKFALIAPQKYEQEALEIFTPEILDEIMSLDHPHDVEIVDSELLIFREGLVDDRTDLEKEFDHAKKLLAVLAPRLDRAHYHKVGDLSDSLR